MIDKQMSLSGGFINREYLMASMHIVCERTQICISCFIPVDQNTTYRWGVNIYNSFGVLGGKHFQTYAEVHSFLESGGYLWLASLCK